MYSARPASSTASSVNQPSTTPRTTRAAQLFDKNLLIGIVVVLGLLAVSLTVGEYSILEGERGWEMFGITRVPRTIALVLACLLYTFPSPRD